MDFSAKATRFLIEAVDHYQVFLSRRVDQEDLSDDEVSDLTNDQEYLEEIKRDLVKWHSELVKEHAALEVNR